MKVTVINQADKRGENHRISIRVNSVHVVDIGDSLSETPEDATLDRDLSFVYDIPDLMEMAYTAGRNGEEFEIQHIDTHSIFDYDHDL